MSDNKSESTVKSFLIGDTIYNYELSDLMPHDNPDIEYNVSEKSEQIVVKALYDNFFANFKGGGLNSGKAESALNWLNMPMGEISGKTIIQILDIIQKDAKANWSLKFKLTKPVEVKRSTLGVLYILSCYQDIINEILDFERLMTTPGESANRLQVGAQPVNILAFMGIKKEESKEVKEVSAKK
jgi:hypothetical protein